VGIVTAVDSTFGIFKTMIVDVPEDGEVTEKASNRFAKHRHQPPGTRQPQATGRTLARVRTS
jgi:hypothetical protein